MVRTHKWCKLLQGETFREYVAMIILTEIFLNSYCLSGIFQRIQTSGILVPVLKLFFNQNVYLAHAQRPHLLQGIHALGEDRVAGEHHHDWHGLVHQGQGTVL